MTRKDVEGIHNYFRSARRVGMTTAFKEAMEGKGYIVFPTIKDAKMQRCDNAITPCEMSKWSGKEYKPTILDNHTVIELSAATLQAFDTIDKKQFEVDERVNQIVELKQQVWGLDEDKMRLGMAMDCMRQKYEKEILETRTKYYTKGYQSARKHTRGYKKQLSKRK